jgi:hypothetical protein
MAQYVRMVRQQGLRDSQISLRRMRDSKAIVEVSEENRTLQAKANRADLVQGRRSRENGSLDILRGLRSEATLQDRDRMIYQLQKRKHKREENGRLIDRHCSDWR